MHAPALRLSLLCIVDHKKTQKIIARPSPTARRTMSRFCRSIKAILCLFFLTFHTMVLSVPVARSPTINFNEMGARPSSSNRIERRAVHLNAAMTTKINGDWYARFSSLTFAMSAGIAASNLEQLFSRALDLTDPGYQNSPLHGSFRIAAGDLELVFHSADPAYAVPWALIHDFLWQAGTRAAGGLAGLYAGQLRNSAGQAVNFALRLRATRSGSSALG